MTPIILMGDFISKKVIESISELQNMLNHQIMQGSNIDDIELQ